MPDSKPPTLQTFTLAELAQFTREGTYASDASPDFHLFYVGRDAVHEVLKYVISRITVSLYLNMFGYDDEELNELIMEKAADPSITMLVTLDRSQAGGVHEKLILSADVARNPDAFNTHFAIGESATHQISHTKGFVADGRVAAEGSTNWSVAGEGTFIVLGENASQKPGFKAQNNTQSIITDTDTCSRFTAELIAEHMVAQSQGRRLAGKPARARTGRSARASASSRRVGSATAGKT